MGLNIIGRRKSINKEESPTASEDTGLLRYNFPKLALAISQNRLA